MTMKKYINLNDYTLLKDSANEVIRFYPEAAILKQVVDYQTDTLYIEFNIEKDPKTKVNIMYVSLINSDNEELYKSYSIYLKEVSLYKYVILNSINDYADAEIMPSLIIDFNKLNYNNFLNILANHKDLSRMVPDLKNALESDIKSLSEAKNIAEIINVQSPLNYFQNITGYLINEIEQIVSNDEEEDISHKILKSFKKKYEIALNDKNQITLSFLSLQANLLGKVKSNNLVSKNILETAELKTDTNKEGISLKELNNILESIVEKEKSNKPIPDDLNIIQERIVYLIENKPKVKQFNNLLKVILASEKYISNNKRVRAIDEQKLKELVIKSLTKLTYRTLPRNQILIYNLEENVDFIAIISTDKIMELLSTYHINRNSDKLYLDLYKKVSDIIYKDDVKKDATYLIALIYNLLAINIYYYKNISNSILLFDKGEAIINLDYKEGEYDISIINKNTNKKMANISKIAYDTKITIKNELKKSEKAFTSFINKIIYNNLIKDLEELAINVEIKNISHNGIIISFKKHLKEDIFTGEFTLGELLTIFATVKELKRKEPKKEEVEEIDLEEVEEEEEPEEETMNEEEKNAVLRKASAIAEVMNNRPIDNDNYKEIAEIFNEYRKTKNEELLPTLKEALEKK